MRLLYAVLFTLFVLLAPQPMGCGYASRRIDEVTEANARPYFNLSGGKRCWYEKVDGMLCLFCEDSHGNIGYGGHSCDWSNWLRDEAAPHLPPPR